MKMRSCMFVLFFFTISETESLNRINLPPSYKPISMLSTRRILRGRLTHDTRPYMVYLRPADGADQRLIDTHWLCGGVIIDESHILTSAACIEDVELFFVISGTHKWIPPEVKNNECIINGAKKAVWKCVPKSHHFHHNNVDNFNWMVGDIAIVRVEDDFNFERKIKGCDFIPSKIEINNHSIRVEQSGTIASIAGWGTTKSFANIDRNPIEKANNSIDLLETNVIIISKKGCKNHWDPRYHKIIDSHIICTKDSSDFDIGLHTCLGHEANCKLIEDFDEEYFDSKPILPKRRMIVDPNKYIVHTAAHHSLRRGSQTPTGGFCENDHGGPLIFGQGKKAMVIGIMSACQTRDVTRKCFGPFLFTSVFKYKEVISFCSNLQFRKECKMMINSPDSVYDEHHYKWKQPGFSRPDYGNFIKVRSYVERPLHPKILPSHIYKNNAPLTTTTKTVTETQVQVSSNLGQENRDLINPKPQKGILSGTNNTSQEVVQLLEIEVVKLVESLVLSTSSTPKSQDPKRNTTKNDANRTLRINTTQTSKMVHQWRQKY